jgi:hypothetical protein
MEKEIFKHLNEQYSQNDINKLCCQFSKYGFVKLRDLVSNDLRDLMKKEVLKLLDANSERRDLLLSTTGNTPRNMSVVKSEIIAKNSRLISSVANSKSLLNFLSKITKEKLHTNVSKDEEFLITRQEKRNDTHGWHWGDYSFALIWLIETPPLEHGGMLQCVPHTIWDKSNPSIHKILCENTVNTYGFSTGDLYLLRSDTTLHRTVPLNCDATRIILNMTWASASDLERGLHGNDRWWENPKAEAVV